MASLKKWRSAPRLSAQYEWGGGQGSVGGTGQGAGGGVQASWDAPISGRMKDLQRDQMMTVRQEAKAAAAVAKKTTLVKAATGLAAVESMGRAVSWERLAGGDSD